MTILDSNIWIAFFNENDSQHKKAEKIFKELNAAIALPECIIIEVASILLFKAGRKTANNFIKSIADNEDVEILPSSELFLNMVINNFIHSSSDKLSFVDVALLRLSKSYQVITFDMNLRKAVNSSVKA